VKCQAGAFCRLRLRAPASPAPILSSFGSSPLVPFGSCGLGGIAFSSFSMFSEAITPLRIAFIVGPLSAVSLKKGRMLMRLFAVASHKIVSTSELGCAPPGVHVVGT